MCEKINDANDSSAMREATQMTRRMICGGLSGMVAKTATNPLERIKMLSQTGEHGSVQRQSIHSIRGLWAGNGANLVRVFPAKAVVFSCNDQYRAFFYRFSGTPKSESLPVYLSFLAGGLAGMTATATTYPLDLARGRISGKLKIEGSQRHYTGILDTIFVTVKEEGILALYKGVTPTVLGALPYEGIKFGTVGVLENIFQAKDEGEKPSIWRKLAFGGIGGIMAGIITYPNDTVRRKLQLQGSKGTLDAYTGYWDCVRKIYAKCGIQRFYHGLFVNIVRMAPNTAIQFGTYEILKQMSEGLL